MTTREERMLDRFAEVYDDYKYCKEKSYVQAMQNNEQRLCGAYYILASYYGNPNKLRDAIWGYFGEELGKEIGWIVIHNG